MLTIACGLVVGLLFVFRFDLVSGCLVVMHTYLCYFQWSLELLLILDYYSNSKLYLINFYTTRVLVTFNFRLQISISGFSFCNQLMNCWNSWKPGASRL